MGIGLERPGTGLGDTGPYGVGSRLRAGGDRGGTIDGLPIVRRAVSRIRLPAVALATLMPACVGRLVTGLRGARPSLREFLMVLPSGMTRR